MDKGGLQGGGGGGGLSDHTIPAPGWSFFTAESRGLGGGWRVVTVITDKNGRTGFGAGVSGYG